MFPKVFQSIRLLISQTGRSSIKSTVAQAGLPEVRASLSRQDRGTMKLVGGDAAGMQQIFTDNVYNMTTSACFDGKREFHIYWLNASLFMVFGSSVTRGMAELQFLNIHYKGEGFVFNKLFSEIYEAAQMVRGSEDDGCVAFPYRWHSAKLQ